MQFSESAEAIEEHSLKLLLEQRPHVTRTILDRPHGPANKKTTLARDKHWTTGSIISWGAVQGSLFE